MHHSGVHCDPSIAYTLDPMRSFSFCVSLRITLSTDSLRALHMLLLKASIPARVSIVALFTPLLALRFAGSRLLALVALCANFRVFLSRRTRGQEFQAK